MVSKDLQAKVLAAYRPGQEKDKLPSLDWRIAALKAIADVALKEHGEAINQELIERLKSQNTANSL